MRNPLALALPAVLLSLAAAAPPATPRRAPALPGTIVDLTHSFDAQTIYWPTAGSFVLESVAHGVTDKGYFYAANRFCAAEHGGTHLDAPVHFAERGRALDAIPVEQLIPGLNPEAARWLVQSRTVKAIGLDTPSIDYGQSTLFESHVILFGAGVPALENVAAMDALPVKNFVVAALPMKIAGGSGGPLRIVAWW